MRTLVREIINLENKKVELMGWVATRRDHGKLIFIDLRDRSGVIQAVFLPKPEELHALADKLRSEWVVKLKGKVAKRPENMVNKEIETGEFEIQAEGLEIINESEALPIAIDTNGYEIGEDSRMKYRYLDLRRERLNKNIKIRAKIEKLIRDFLTEKEFVEIETPILGKSTPEGARDYLVPSRLEPGRFYALPQAPQQYKQLLMVAGIERYFQIARCFRDEDTRGDRQPEFTQLDMEMSFVEREDVMCLNEELLIKLVKELMPEKKIQEIPFPRLSYKDAMEKYDTDRPDLRKDKNDPNLLAFCWVIDFPFFKKSDGGWTFTHNPFSAPKPEYIEFLLRQESISEILAGQYDIILNGFEIGGGSIRNHKPEALKAVFKIMGFTDERVKENFGHMLEAFKYGAPPHGGIAWGLDRLIALLQDEPNIREVIAFPKTGDGGDLMMGAPSDVESEQLKELHIKVVNDEKTKK
ncbi:MAG: aspartate--tRNA ligase [Spirochaetia bacterium]|nr:MAG: aspartate--tRNA ligase [Spirochaetia bacterium]